MSKFKIGDKVMVRPDLVDDVYYNSVYVNKDMIKLRGKFVTITSVNGTDRYYIKENSYTWTDDMFCVEGTQTFKLTEESVRDLLKCPKGYVIECGDMPYSPYTIKEDGVYDKDDDQTDFIEFLTDLHEYDYKIKKESDYVVEMTLAEVCEKLGKNIKIIKE